MKRNLIGRRLKLAWVTTRCSLALTWEEYEENEDDLTASSLWVLTICLTTYY